MAWAVCPIDQVHIDQSLLLLLFSSSSPSTSYLFWLSPFGHLMATYQTIFLLFLHLIWSSQKLGNFWSRSGHLSIITFFLYHKWSSQTLRCPLCSCVSEPRYSSLVNNCSVAGYTQQRLTVSAVSRIGVSLAAPALYIPGITDVMVGEGAVNLFLLHAVEVGVSCTICVLFLTR